MTDAADDDVFLTVQELAARWRLSPMTIHRRIHDESLPVVVVSPRGGKRKHVRIRLSDVERIEATGSL